jgi:hypothetical protein
MTCEYGRCRKKGQKYSILSERATKALTKRHPLFRFRIEAILCKEHLAAMADFKPKSKPAKRR